MGVVSKQELNNRRDILEDHAHLKAPETPLNLSLSMAAQLPFTKVTFQLSSSIFNSFVTPLPQHD